MEKWEYMSAANCSDATLNSLGAQGWELVAVVQRQGMRPSQNTFYFKRRKP
jgi:hypothetical protein